MLKRFVIAACVLFPVWSFAAPNPVRDANNSLEFVDNFLGNQRFETLLTCGSKAQFATPLIKAELTCDENSCWGVYENIENQESGAEIGGCDEKSVSIYFDNGKIWEIAKTDFDSAKGNLSRLFLGEVSNFIGYEGSVEVVSAEAGKVTLVSGQVVDGVNIKSNFSLPGQIGQGYPMIISVIKGSSGVSQVARFRFDGQTVFRLKGI